MTKPLFIPLVALAALWIAPLSEADAEADQPHTYCRFVPERLDDFAWKNDLIAFRADGPARSGYPRTGTPHSSTFQNRKI